MILEGDSISNLLHPPNLLLAGATFDGWRVRCGFQLRNPLIRNQTLASRDFLRDPGSGPRCLKILSADQDEKVGLGPNNEKKSHETCPEGLDFDEKSVLPALCFKAHLPRGVPARSGEVDFFEKIRTFSETLGRRRDFLKSPALL